MKPRVYFYTSSLTLVLLSHWLYIISWEKTCPPPFLPPRSVPFALYSTLFLCIISFPLFFPILLLMFLLLPYVFRALIVHIPLSYLFNQYFLSVSLFLLSCTQPPFPHILRVRECSINCFIKKSLSLFLFSLFLVVYCVRPYRGTVDRLFIW